MDVLIIVTGVAVIVALFVAGARASPRRRTHDSDGSGYVPIGDSGWSGGDGGAGCEEAGAGSDSGGGSDGGACDGGGGDGGGGGGD